ncbi:hypothetical protein D3C72_757450 [compost metagenome]
MFFIYIEIQLFIYFRHIALLFCDIMVFCLLHDLAVTLFTQEFDNRTIFRHTFIGTVQLQTTGIFICLTFFNQFFRFIQGLVHHASLYLNDFLNSWFQELELLIITFRYRT